MIPRAVLITACILLAGVFAMGFYGLHLKHQAEEMQARQQVTRPIAPPVAGKTEAVSLYVADDEYGTLREEKVKIALPSEPGPRAREILRALFAVSRRNGSTHSLPAQADVRAVFMVAGGTAVIDTNSEFAERHHSGVLLEELTLASIARTLAANFPHLKQVKILVDGRERDTLAGHADLKSFYSTSPEALVQ